MIIFIRAALWASVPLWDWGGGRLLVLLEQDCPWLQPLLFSC